MRIIYFDDIKRGFKIDTDAVIFKGRFFLLRNPETPLEGATKEYVDTLFKKLNPDVLGDMLIKESQFPAFDGDIKNEKGKNYFLLANVIKSGRYCLVETDSKGRVIKGEKQLSQKVVNLAKEIPFKSIDFSTYKSIGHVNNMGRSIKDFTFNSKEKCLSIFDANIINKNITIEYNINEKNAVVNEAIFEATIGMYVPIAIGLSKRDDYDFLIKDGDHGDGITDPGIKDEFEYRYRAAGGRPWHLQYDISPKGKGIGNSVKVVITDATTSNMKRLGDIFVDQGFLKVFNNDGNLSSQAKLSESGDIVPGDITNASTPVLPSLNDTNSTRPLYVMVDRYLYALVTEGSKCRVKIAVPEGKSWAKTWLNGPLINITDIRAFRMLVIGERLYFLNMAGLKSYYCNIPADKTKVGSPVEMTGDIAPPQTGEQPYGIAAYLYNGYVYLIPGHQKHYEDSKVPYNERPVSTQYLRAQFTGSTLSKWEKVECGFSFPDAMRVPYAYHGKMYFVTGRYQPINKRMRKLDVEELVNNLLVLRLNGDNNVMGVEMPKDIPNYDEIGSWAKNPYNQPAYKTTNPHYISEYTKPNPNYLPERWEPDPRNRPAYTDNNGVEYPEVKYPDVYYPAQGAPNIVVPAVGPKEITVPAEIYPDVWIASEKGHWIPNPNNEPGKWIPNPDYVPASEKPNPDYKPGFWSPDPRNKEGYWQKDDNPNNGVWVDAGTNGTTPAPGPTIDLNFWRKIENQYIGYLTGLPGYEIRRYLNTKQYEYFINTYNGSWAYAGNRPCIDIREGYYAPMLNIQPNGTVNPGSMIYLVRLDISSGRFICTLHSGSKNTETPLILPNSVTPVKTKLLTWSDFVWGETYGIFGKDQVYIPGQIWIPPVKYPDIWNPPVGEPTIITPEVGEKEIWIPEKNYPDIWVPEQAGKWVPDPRNKPAYCEPNPNYKPGYWRPGEGVPEYIEKPNPDYVPGYWKPDPRNKPGYWTGPPKLNSDGIDFEKKIVNLSKLAQVSKGVFSRVPKAKPVPAGQSSPNYDIVDGINFSGNKQYEAKFRHAEPGHTAAAWPGYSVNNKYNKGDLITAGDMGYMATGAVVEASMQSTDGPFTPSPAVGYVFRVTSISATMVYGGACRISTYKRFESWGTIAGQTDWAIVCENQEVWKVYDPNDKGEWVPEVKYPDVWVPPKGEPTIRVKNPDYIPGKMVPNPDYKPGYYKDDPNDPMSDMSRPYFDMDKAVLWQGSVMTSGLGGGGQPGGSGSNEQSSTGSSMTFRVGRALDKQYDASYAKGGSYAGATSPPSSIHLGGYRSRFANPLGMFTMTVDGKVYYFYATGTKEAVNVEACYTGYRTSTTLWSASFAGNQEIIERGHDTIYNTTPYRAVAGYGPRKPKQVWVDPVGEKEIWQAGNGSADVWVPPVGEKEICYPEVKYPDIWVPAEPPKQSDLEPDVNISTAAAKDGLFISSGYKLWRVPLEGGENNYDEYLSSDYTPVNK